MSARTYENFDLLVEAQGDGSFRARVTSSPSRDSASTEFRIPFDETRLENLLLKLDPGRSRTRRGSLDPRAAAGSELGSALYASLFSGDVAIAWARSRDAVLPEGKGLRVRLMLDQAPQIAGLPWELLYDGRTSTYLAQSERTPVVRLLDVPHSLRPLRVDGPLRVLAVVSSPSDLEALDVDSEWDHIQEALGERMRSGSVVLDRLPKPTLSALGAWLRTHTAHVLHFVGHGDFDERRDNGVLYFCDQYGRGVPVTASMLGPFILDHDPLRLLVLNACRTASVRTDDPFAGMAQGLVRQNAGAVIAMQFPITDRAAITFTAEFYGAVADGYPVDQAATYARKALFAGFGSEWATPTVFVQATDGVVFDHITAQPRATVPAEPEGADDATGASAPSDPGPTLVGTSRRDRRRVMVAAVGAGVAIVAVALALRPLLDGGGTGDDEPTDTAQTRTAVPGPLVSASYLPTVQVDGDGSDWPGSPTYRAENVVVLDDEERPVDSEWQVAWDERHLYILVRVTDADITQTRADEPSQAWLGDSIHFELGPFLEQVRTDVLDPLDRQVIIAPTEGGGVVGAVNAARGDAMAPSHNLSDRDGVAEVELTDDGYLVEAAILWATLGVTEAEAGDRYALNINVSDAVPAGDRRGELATLQSNNRERSDNDVSTRHLWGTLALAAP